MRLTVTMKAAIGVASISVIGILAMMIIYFGLNAVSRIVHKYAEEEEPFNAAAYEMEINANGIGFAVLNYLSTLDPHYRAWVANDHADFERYHAAFLKLAKTPAEKEPGERIHVLHAQFQALGNGLMQRRDRQEDLFTRVAANVEKIDRIMDDQLGPAIDRATFGRLDQLGKSLAVTNLEAEIAELSFWVANYHRGPTLESRTLILGKLQEFRDALAGFTSLRLGAEEQGLAVEIGRIFEQTADAIPLILSMEDLAVKERQQFVGLRLAMDHLLDTVIQPLTLRALDLPRRRVEQATNRVQRVMVYLIPAFLFVSGLVGLLLIRSVIRPLRALRLGTEAITQGNLAYRIPTSQNDEFGDLARSFNQMSEQLLSSTVSKGQLLESETKLRQSVSDLLYEIKERERAEQQRAGLEADLHKSEIMAAMGALTAGVAHEVRNPLFGISSTLDAMEARFSSYTEFRRYFEVLRGEVNRMNGLMADLLQYGKPVALELRAPALAADVIAQAVNASLPIAHSAGVMIVHQPRTDLPPVLADQTRLAQVFQNLLENAIHFSPRGARITIEAQAARNAGATWVECAIEDCGPGFKPEDLPHIFEPFFTRRRGGTGLGLSIVRRIVEAHGGDIVAANRAEGGAIVTVRLPVAPAKRGEDV